VTGTRTRTFAAGARPVSREVPNDTPAQERL
jgi:hypothetical protein